MLRDRRVAAYRRGAQVLIAACILGISLVACGEPDVPRAIVTGVVLTPSDGPFVGADVVAMVWVDPPECAGEPFGESMAESREDGSFTLPVFGRRGVDQQDACVVVSARPPPNVSFIPGGTNGLPITLRVDQPETVSVEITLGRPPP